jgi:hypothetical protein
VNAPGGASLNAADRSAIIDLFGAYAQDYDAGKPGEFPQFSHPISNLWYPLPSRCREKALQIGTLPS